MFGGPQLRQHPANVLLADARRLKVLASEQDIDIDYLEYEGMYHGWAMEPSREGRTAVRQIVSILREGRSGWPNE